MTGICGITDSLLLQLRLPTQLLTCSKLRAGTLQKVMSFSNWCTPSYPRG
jgi:hypothetical protein